MSAHAHIRLVQKFERLRAKKNGINVTVTTTHIDSLGRVLDTTWETRARLFCIDGKFFIKSYSKYDHKLRECLPDGTFVADNSLHADKYIKTWKLTK